MGGDVVFVGMGNAIGQDVNPNGFPRAHEEIGTRRWDDYDATSGKRGHQPESACRIIEWHRTENA